MLVQYKVGTKKREMGEVKQSGMLEERKKYTAQPHYMGLSLFPDVFKDSGFIINKDVIHGLSPCLVNRH
jgi:hypothetical protein